MKVQNISGYNTASFKGLKEIQGIEKKYAKGEQDKKLVEKALYANTAEMDITSDGVFVEKNDAEKIDSFLTAAQKARNGKLAFFLAEDLRKSFHLHDRTASNINDAMINIARKSDAVTKQDVLDYLV